MLLGAVCGAGLVVWAVLGAKSSQTPTDVPKSGAVLVVEEAKVNALTADLTVATEANRRLMSRVAQLEALLNVAAGEGEGEERPAMVRPGDVEELPSGETAALPFAPDLAPAYTPEGFEAVALQMERECDLGLEVVTIDCSEYPCMAWTRAEHPEGRGVSMDGCAPWTAAFPNGTTVIGTASRKTADGNSEMFFSWMAVPENPDQLKQAWRRAQVRAGEMKTAMGLE